jgi:hypothetical protein
VKAITDTANAPITSLQMSLTEETESSVFVVRVPCLAGQKLRSDPNPYAQVLARESGSGDAFQDIAASPIDLAPYAGTLTLFDVKVAALSVEGLKRAALSVRVSY